MTVKNSALIVIPARKGSSRFPNKPMAQIKGKTMIERVWRLAMASKLASKVLIATDSEQISNHAKKFGANVMMSPSDCKTGTDRVAYCAKQFQGKHDIIFSLQGDAVLTPPWVIDDVLNTMLTHPEVKMATPVVKLQDAPLIAFAASKRSGSTTGTSVVFDLNNDALYFSKALIPVTRNVADNAQVIYRHIGLYAYRDDTLAQLTALPQTPFECAEQLEQLRALENKIPIRVVHVDYHNRTHGSVDEPDDIEVVEKIISDEGELV